MIEKVQRVLSRIFYSIHSGLETRLTNLHKNLQIGEGTVYSRSNLDGIAPQLARIGKNCVFAPTAVVLTHDASYFPTLGKYRIAPVEIGDRVFLGYGAIVMPGVKIGSDVVVLYRGWFPCPGYWEMAIKFAAPRSTFFSSLYPGRPYNP